MFRPACGLLARTFLPAILLLPVPARSAPGGEVTEAPRVDRQLGPYVHAVVLRAAERLAHEPCSLVLSDYADPRTGRPLVENLPASGRGAAAYLASLTYRLAPEGGPCRTSSVSAYTTPGGSVVYVCKRRFLHWQEGNDQNLPADILIHEALHTLGLGENPPSTEEITARVASRCDP